MAAYFPGLRIYAPTPAYVFSLKAYAGRPEDLRDLAVLRRAAGWQTVQEALAAVRRYIPDRLLTARVQFMVETVFDEDEPDGDHADQRPTGV